MPDLIFPNREALPEELRPFAKDADGGVVINLVANDKLKELRDSNVAVSKERDDLKAVVTNVTKLFPEFDAEKVGAELTELRGISQRVKDGKLTESKSVEEALAERTKTMKQQYEEQIQQRTQEAKTNRERAASLESRLKQQAVRQAVLGVVMDEKTGVQPSAVDDIVNRAFGVFSVENDGDKITPKIGDTILYGADGTTPMTPTEWVASLKDKSPHLFRQSNGGGGSGGSNTGDKRFGGFTSEEIAKMSPEQKLQMANDISRPKGM